MLCGRVSDMCVGGEDMSSDSASYQLFSFPHLSVLGTDLAISKDYLYIKVSQNSLPYSVRRYSRGIRGNHFN